MPPGRKPGFIPLNKHIWTQAEMDFLKDNYCTMTNGELASKLNMKLTSVRTQLYSMGFKRMELEYWTEEQTKFLKDNYKTIGDIELSEMFEKKWPKNKKWSKKHIEKKRKYLKLNRTQDEVKSVLKRNIDLGRFADCAVKRWKVSGAKPIGHVFTWKSESGQPLLVIKTKDGMVHYRRWLYEQTFGAIPDGMMVEIKDGNPLNIVPENLYLGTRSDHALLNAQKSIQGLSDNYIAGILTHKRKDIREDVKQNKGLIELKRLQITLKRAINERKNNKEGQPNAQ
jgi:hypothetical protein